MHTMVKDTDGEQVQKLQFYPTGFWGNSPMYVTIFSPFLLHACLNFV